MQDNTFIALIVGLPGSGKTFLANQLSTPSAVIVDDIKDMNQLPDSGDIIITDVNFCDSNVLEKAKAELLKKYGIKTHIEVYYFECDADAARRNVKHRDDGRNVEGTIRRFEKIYKPLEDEALKIWNPDIDGTND